MRAESYFRVLGFLALAGGTAVLGHAGQVPVQPSQIRNQLNNAQNPAPAAQSPAPQTAPKPMPKPAPKPAAPKPKPAPRAQSAPKPAPRKMGQPKTTATASAPPVKAPPKEATPAAPPAATNTTAEANPPHGPRRDPFVPLVGQDHSGGGRPENLPPGKAGLVVSEIRVDGLVHGPDGMIAVVSNPQGRVYFLHAGDKLYDGSVERITLEEVSFHESGEDAFGKPVEREVTKRLYPSSGEQQ